jgi:hypothetical protein
MRTRLAIAICVVTLAASGQVLAHHSFTAEFDADKPVKLTGTVTKVEWTNPHTWFFIDVKNPDGTVSNWGFEMPGPAQLLRQGLKRDTMKIGDTLTVDARRARDGTTNANAQKIWTGDGKQLFPGTGTTE